MQTAVSCIDYQPISNGDDEIVNGGGGAGGDRRVEINLGKKNYINSSIFKNTLFNLFCHTKPKHQ